jgi:hypothetical protein
VGVANMLFGSRPSKRHMWINRMQGGVRMNVQRSMP